MLLPLALVGCQPAAGPPLLTDAREILNRTIGATATIRTVHARFDVTIRTLEQAPGMPVQDQGGAAEGDIDLAAGEFGLTIVPNDGNQRMSFILADGSAFTQDPFSGRWTRMDAAGGLPGLAAGGLFGAAAGPAPDPGLILAEAVGDPTTTLELRGVEDCATGRCYRLAIGLTPERVFKAFVALTAVDRLPGFEDQADAMIGSIPGLGLEIAADTTTFRIVDGTLSASMPGTAVALRMQLSRFDEAVSIQPPPPAIVDEFDLDGILNDVGADSGDDPPPIAP
jgi:hypothetical protein